MAAISVIIPTWNWSAALWLAITSVLRQTERDFELLVIGDGCTDDSADVVASFGDPRIRFHNLPENHGSQWAADNAGLAMATSPWVAYLGHDDVWYPTHLEAILRTARTSDADIVTSVMVMYGPPGSRIRSLAGVFPGGLMAPNDIVPPSALAHRRSLFEGGVRWRDPTTLALPVDVVFLRDLIAASPRVASTGELTVFKFNAAWRRDAYRRKSVDEQTAMLARIAEGGDFRHRELIEVIAAMVGDRFVPLASPDVVTDAPGAGARRARQFKGTERRFAAGAVRPVTAVTRFDVAAQDAPFEWHPLERHSSGGPVRWTGPSPRATFDLPVLVDRDLDVALRVAYSLTPEALQGLTLSVNGRPLSSRIEPAGDGYVVRARLNRDDVPDSDDGFGLTIDVPAMSRPSDHGFGNDRRWVGVAVQWVELAPAEYPAVPSRT